MFMVKINTWNNIFDDTYDFEYSGIEYETREEAEKELQKAIRENGGNFYVESIYIVEVD